MALKKLRGLATLTNQYGTYAIKIVSVTGFRSKRNKSSVVDYS